MSPLQAFRRLQVSLRPRACPAWWAGLGICLLVLPNLAVRTQILNSERIEERFGTYGIDVVYSDDSLRISNLYSRHDETKITRTLAIVGYPEALDAAVEGVHGLVVAGGSIGATFEDAGWEVVKTGHTYFRAAPPAAVLRGMAVSPDTQLAAHAYQLTVTQGDRRVDYAWIIEIHHPAYLSEDDLEMIYGPAQTVGMPEAMRLLLEQGWERFARFGLTLRQ